MSKYFTNSVTANNSKVTGVTHTKRIKRNVLRKETTVKAG